MGYFVPELLKTKKNWNVWEKGTKKPFYIKQGEQGIEFKRGGHTTRAKCVDYETALFALENSDFGGIGFCFFSEDNLTFIDLDNCIEDNGEISELATEIIGMFPDTYTEVSQSERGLHIIAIGTVPRAVKRQGIEIYSEGRYMAFTGNAWNTSEPCEHQAEINELFKRFSEPPARLTPVSTGNKVTSSQGTPPEPHIEPYSDLSGQVRQTLALIRKSRQNEKFELLHAGAWEEATDRNEKHFCSQSEAEQAYIAIVSYFTNYNYELTKTIFKQSKLCARPKYTKSADVFEYHFERMFENAIKTACRQRGFMQRRKNLTDWTGKPRRKKF